MIVFNEDRPLARSAERLARRQLGALAPEPIPYQTKLQNAIRTFPKTFGWRQAAEALEAAALDGHKAESRAGLPGMGTDPAPLARAVERAENLAKAWRNRAPWFWQTAPVWKATDTEGKAVLAAIGAVYSEASALAGERSVVVEARKQLKDDLVQAGKDLPGDLWGKARPWVIGAVVLGAGYAAWKVLK